MRIEQLFKEFQELNNLLDGELLEISVKQHQVTFIIKDSLMKFSQIQKLFGVYNSEECFFSTNNDKIYVIFDEIDLKALDKDNRLYIFLDTISEFVDKICTCPALEFVIAEEYIKCYLDKPGLSVLDLLEYEKILEAKGRGELELHPQRPYLLFINDLL